MRDQRLTCIIFHGIVAILVSAFAQPTAGAEQARGDRPPNIVLIFCDDLGYADIGPFGGKSPTPHLDRLAKEGMRFTNFCVAQAVCSASRAALMTGCYPNRVGIQGALGPKSKTGLHPEELTLAELVKQKDYATAIVGKWHLGDAPNLLPTRQGFDEYFGLPYSNDMWPNHPTNKTFPPLPLYENEKIIEVMPDQTQLTTRYTERAVAFIEKNKDRPFFLYLAHSMPHVPLFVSDKFRGKSGQGLYGDVIMEIDWSVGQILGTLDDHQLDQNSLVIFTSDNGPWLSYGNHAGSAGHFREGKATTFEGGIRVPMLARWPEKMPAGKVCDHLARTIDIFPTIAGILGAELSSDRRIDGHDLRDSFTGGDSGNNGATNYYYYYYYWNQELHAVREGKWKLHLPHKYSRPEPAGGNGKPGKIVMKEIGLALFDLDREPVETTDVSDSHRDVVARLQELAEQARDDLGDSLTGRAGKNLRPAGVAEW
jgi:arylsulfatase A